MSKRLVDGEMMGDFFFHNFWCLQTVSPHRVPLLESEKSHTRPSVYMRVRIHARVYILTGVHTCACVCVCVRTKTTPGPARPPRGRMLREGISETEHTLMVRLSGTES